MVNHKPLGGSSERHETDRISDLFEVKYRKAGIRRKGGFLTFSRTIVEPIQGQLEIDKILHPYHEKKFLVRITCHTKRERLKIFIHSDRRLT